MIIDDAVILKEQKEQERKEKAELRNGFQKILEQSFLIGHELSTNQNYFIRKPFKGVVLRLCKC